MQECTFGLWWLSTLTYDGLHTAYVLPHWRCPQQVGLFRPPRLPAPCCMCPFTPAPPPSIPTCAGGGRTAQGGRPPQRGRGGAAHGHIQRLCGGHGPAQREWGHVGGTSARRRASQAACCSVPCLVPWGASEGWNAVCLPLAAAPSFWIRTHGSLHQTQSRGPLVVLATLPLLAAVLRVALPCIRAPPCHPPWRLLPARRTRPWGTRDSYTCFALVYKHTCTLCTLYTARAVCLPAGPGVSPAAVLRLASHVPCGCGAAQRRGLHEHVHHGRKLGAGIRDKHGGQGGVWASGVPRPRYVGG